MVHLAYICSMATESIIHKIRKLIDKSKSTDSIHEAEACMLQAQSLLQKYNLEQSVIDSHTHVNANSEIITEMVIQFEDEWQSILINSITKNNFCYALNTSFGENKQITIIGKGYNIETCIYLINFFRSRLLELSIVAYSDFIDKRNAQLREALGMNINELGNKRAGEAIKKNYLNEYLIGGVHGISAKMREHLLIAQKSSSDVKGLMLYNDSAIQKYVKETYGKTRKGKGSKIGTNGEGYQRGISDGRSLDAGTQGKDGRLVKCIG